MIVVRFKVQCQPGHTEDVVVAMQGVLEAARLLPGVIHFDIARDLSDPNALIATEVFENREAMEGEESLPEVGKVIEIMQAGALAGPPEWTIFEVASAESPSLSGEAHDGGAGDSADRHTVEAFFTLFGHAWKRNDSAAVADVFVEDGSLINPFGERADGRDAIAGMYAEYFRGMLQGTSTDFRLTSVRLVEDGHAFVDGEQSINGPSGNVVLVVHLAALLRRDNGSWRFVDSRPYTLPAPPG